MPDTPHRSDFSGEWTLNLRDSTLSPGVAAAVRGGTLSIEHHEPRFAVHLTVVFDEKPFDVQFELTTDDGEVTEATPEQPLVTSLRWDGDALVSVSREWGPGGEVIISFRYALEDGGHRLRATEHVRGGGRDQDNVWVYDQRPA